MEQIGEGFPLLEETTICVVWQRDGIQDYSCTLGRSLRGADRLKRPNPIAESDRALLLTSCPPSAAYLDISINDGED